MTLADRMAVFMDGRIVQVGTPQRDLRAARARSTVAGFIGTPPMNLLPAELATARVRRCDGATPAGGAATARRARAVTLGVRPGRPAHRAPTALAAPRRAASRTSATARIVNCDVDGQPLKLEAATSAGRCAEGETVHLSLRAGGGAPVRPRERRTPRLTDPTLAAHDRHER